MTTDRDDIRRTDDAHATKARPRALALAIALLVLWGLAGPALPARADELVVNGAFDHDLSAWGYFNQGGYHTEWSAEDADDSPSSGSAELSNSQPEAGYSAILMHQCLSVTPGATYRASAKVLIPDGQARSGASGVLLLWWAQEDCVNESIRADFIGYDFTPGEWQDYEVDLTAPPGAVAVEVRAGVDKTEAGGVLTAHVDDVSVMPAGEAPPPDDCGTLPGPALLDGDFPGYRFRVEIVNAAGSLPAVSESSCLPETLCVSGALPGRTEAELRLIGPRPNGHLWLQVVRFTPSELRIEAEKVSDGTCQRYTLPAIPPGSDTLDGLVDRTAFVP